MAHTAKANTDKEHVLFELTQLDGLDREIEDKTKRSYHNVKQMIADKSAKECQEIYLKYIAANPQANLEELTMGLLVAVLVEPDKASDYFRDIACFSKDSLASFGSSLNMIIVERISKLSDAKLKQIFWVANQLMKAGCGVAENTCSNLIRQTAGGDLSPRNLFMVENLLDLLINNRVWLVNSTSFMGPTVIYNFMRLIYDHMGPNHSALRQKEVDFVIGLIREKIEFVYHIGKDFLRSLHNLIKIPEFEKLYQEIYNNPKALHAKYEGPQSLLVIRTPRRLFQSRLTFDMERKISFLASHVKFGSQKRYQDWFHRQYLATPESHSLRCDLIRYICTIIHPSNEVLCSDIIPRWAIIGWLLTTCTTSASAANSKQALFFDWFAYDAKTDNIMNIEPAILVMYYSIRSHPTLTASLLDYLCRAATAFAPKLSDMIRAGIKKSLQQILEKRVIPALAPLFDNPKHDPGLRALIRETFPEFCANSTSSTTTTATAATATATATAASATTTSTTTTTTTTTSISLDNGTSPHQSAIPTPPLSQTNSPTPDIGNLTPKQQQPEVVIIDDKQPSLMQESSSPGPLDQKAKANHDSNHVHHRNAADQQSVKAAANDVASSRTPVVLNIDSDDSNDLFEAPKQQSPTTNHRAKRPSDADDYASIGGDSGAPTLKSPKLEPVLGSNILNDRLLSKDVAGGGGGGGGKPSSKAKRDLNQHVDNITTFASDDLDATDAASNIRVLYPFMTTKKPVNKAIISTFESSVIVDILEDLSVEKSNETRCNLMDRLISALCDLSDELFNEEWLDDLAAYLVQYQFQDDFTTRIFPSSSTQDADLLSESICSPFFTLCRSAFTGSQSDARPLTLLVAISKIYEATGFLILYYLRVFFGQHNALLTQNYVKFCELAKRKLSKCVHEDLQMLSVYDPDMFCFLITTVFCDMAQNGKDFEITNNCELIQLTVATIDPGYFQELICLCVIGAARILDREDPLPVIESSLNWEYWEQNNFWRLVSASISIDKYISLLPKLNVRAHPVATCCMMLNLQRISEPSADVLLKVFDAFNKCNELYVSSLIRYWAMKTDTKEMAKNILTLIDSRPASPQMKRKGQTKTAASKGVSSLSPRSERILSTLEAVRARAPRSRILYQTELLEVLPQLEPLCSETQKRKFNELLSLKQKNSKKRAKTDKDGQATTT